MMRSPPITPSHVAIIMDGNRRWAKAQGLSHKEGHYAGYDALKALVRQVPLVPSIKVLSVFTFSTENWKRTNDEVEAFFELALFAFVNDIEEFNSNGARVRVVGDVDKLPSTLQQAIREAEDATAANEGFTLVLALNYGGHWDIIQGFQALATRILSDQKKSVEQQTPHGITKNTVEQLLATSFLPPVDLLIRTGGEFRISNFLLWQIAYAELFFSDILWPAFTFEDFRRVLEWFGQRERRYGGNNAFTHNKGIVDVKDAADHYRPSLIAGEKSV